VFPVSSFRRATLRPDHHFVTLLFLITTSPPRVYRGIDLT
jgi:hypothetical protein